MGEKNKKNNEGDQQKNEDKNKKKHDNNDDGVTVVLKTDLHCEGCASKVIKCIRSFEGVEIVTVADGQKITVVGSEIDPVEIRKKLEAKTHKKVELISPQVKTDSDNNNKENNNKNNSKAKGKENSISGNNKDNAKHKEEYNKKKKKESKDSPSKDTKSADEGKKSKEKEVPVTTAVFKVHLHCEGCIHKIYKTVTKTKGYEDIKFDHQKDLVTVTGAMDMKELAESLQKQLKKDVQIVQPKKEGEKKEKDNNGDKDKNGGEGNNNDQKMDANMIQQAHQIGYPNPNPFMYGSSDPFAFNPYTVGSYHAPQIFSDENPNACSVM